MILGGQDGLVNVLGVILGVAAAAGEPQLIIAAGLAATFAESISMGAVAYTSAIADRDYYHGEMERERGHIREFAEIEREEIRRIAAEKGIEGELLDTLVAHITADESRWIDVMMAQEFQLAPVDERGALRRSFFVAIAAIAGSLIPLLPFLILPVSQSIVVSIILTGAALFAVGVYKAHIISIGRWYRSGFQMAAIGILAALAGYLIGLSFQVPAS
ncbi:MAG: VIT1/CCC1 transporter family protein [Anaerolineales bacterium]|nr:VIT1/CCC1 transporter family protein [Anaerolineales bacterium]